MVENPPKKCVQALWIPSPSDFSGRIRRMSGRQLLRRRQTPSRFVPPRCASIAGRGWRAGVFLSLTCIGAWGDALSFKLVERDTRCAPAETGPLRRTRRGSRTKSGTADGCQRALYTCKGKLPKERPHRAVVIEMNRCEPYGMILFIDHHSHQLARMTAGPLLMKSVSHGPQLRGRRSSWSANPSQRLQGDQPQLKTGADQSDSKRRRHHRATAPSPARSRR